MGDRRRNSDSEVRACVDQLRSKPVSPQRLRQHLSALVFIFVSEVLLELGKARLKARPGFTRVLHTWRRDLWFHAHLHVLVTAGGLALDGTRFIHSRKDYLFNDESMGQRLRVKMLDALRKLRAKGAFPELTPGAFGALMASLVVHKVWMVHAGKPFASAHHVLAYLGRYVHRVGMPMPFLPARPPRR